jgi:hypothetical protein
MADNRGDPQLSWQTIVAAIVVVGLIAAAQWTIFQNQFTNVDKTIADLGRRVAILEATQAAITAKLAHDPVEKATFDAVAKSTDDRITLLQSNITDLNRQIAAALIIIDNNSALPGATRRPSLPP